MNTSDIPTSKSRQIKNNFISKICSNTINNRFTTQIYNKYFESPWNNPFVIVHDKTKNSKFILLKSGVVVKKAMIQGSDQGLISLDAELFLNPIIIDFPIKISDISCGRDHCLALGYNNTLFAWGSNKLGQLGLGDMPGSEVIEIKNPSWVDVDPVIVINEICANKNNSFFINNTYTLYGCGDNTKGIINSQSRSPRVTKFQIVENVSKIFENGIKSLKTLIKSQKRKEKNPEDKRIDLQDNRFDEETSVKSQIKELKDKWNWLPKVRITIEEHEEWINEIKNWIVGLEEDNNQLQVANDISRDENETLMNIVKQIDLIQNKKERLNENVRHYFSNWDPRILGTCHSTQDNANTDTPGTKALLYQMSNILERVDSELQVEKFKYLENFQNEKEYAKRCHKKAQVNKELIHLFNKIIKEIENKKDHLVHKRRITEEQRIKDKWFIEHQCFVENTLEKISTTYTEVWQDRQPTIRDLIKLSTGNLIKLREKIENLSCEPGASDTKKNDIINIFNSNILLANQNNYWVYFMINKLTTPVRNSILESWYCTNDKQEDMNEIKTRVINFKEYLKRTGPDFIKYLRDSHLSNEWDSEEEYN